MPGRLLRKPATWLVCILLAAGGGFGLYWFQPWKLVVDERVDEPLSNPVSAADARATPPPSSGADPAASPPDPASPVLIAEGEFISHEHATTGTARIIRNPDETYRLELVGLDTSNGPDLRVWLTDQPVIEGRDGWHVFDDGEWVELGRLSGNQGDQVYDIPAGSDPSDYTSVSIWCRRFSVSFGAATLGTPAR
jgi:electron transfer DM13